MNNLKEIGCNEEDTNGIISWFDNEGLVSTVCNASIGSQGLKFTITDKGTKERLYTSGVFYDDKKCEEELIKKLIELWQPTKKDVQQ